MPGGLVCNLRHVGVSLPREDPRDQQPRDPGGEEEGRQQVGKNNHKNVRIITYI